MIYVKQIYIQRTITDCYYLILLYYKGGQPMRILHINSYKVLFYAILTFGGFFFGIAAWLFLPDFLLEQLRQYYNGQLETLSVSISMKESVAMIARANTIDLLRIYLCGLCLFGVPFLVVFLFLKCFSIGFVSFILLQHSILLFMSRLIYVPFLVLASAVSCKFAVQLIQNRCYHPIRQIVQYSVVFFLVSMMVVFVSLLDGLSNYYYLMQF